MFGKQQPHHFDTQYTADEVCTMTHTDYSCADIVLNIFLDEKILLMKRKKKCGRQDEESKSYRSDGQEWAEECATLPTMECWLHAENAKHHLVTLKECDTLLSVGIYAYSVNERLVIIYRKIKCTLFLVHSSALGLAP